MTFEHCGLSFETAVTDPKQTLEKPGVYVVWERTYVRDALHPNAAIEKWRVLDAGKSDYNIRDRLSNHDRRSQWHYHNKGEIWFAVCYLGNLADRDAAERLVRTAEKPPCGDRI